MRLSKSMDSLTLKRHDSFLNKNNKKVKHSFTPRYLIFKLQQEVLKISDIYVSWSSPKIDLDLNFVNLKNGSFEHVSFSQY